MTDNLNDKVLDLVGLIFESLSEDPKNLEITLESEGTKKTIFVKSNPKDYSHFIGRKGVVIDAVRRLIFSVAADQKCRWTISIPEEK